MNEFFICFLIGVVIGYVIAYSYRPKIEIDEKIWRMKCPQCGGTGVKSWPDGGWSHCVYCDGTGNKDDKTAVDS